MSFAGDLRHILANMKPPLTTISTAPVIRDDPHVNLSAVQARMDSVQKFLSDSVNSNTLLGQHQMNMVSDEITSVIHLIIVNGATLLSSNQLPNLLQPPSSLLKFKINPRSNHQRTFLEFDRRDIKDKVVPESKVEALNKEEDDGDCEINELDIVELLAAHIHFCDFCRKGFKRDANLRMHMRVHGNQYKTAEALSKPEKCSELDSSNKRRRFSCPFVGCARNKTHHKF